PFAAQRNDTQYLIGFAFQPLRLRRQTAVKPNELFDLNEREAELLIALDKGHALQIASIIRPVAGRVSCGLRQQRLPLVKADGLDVHAGTAGQFSDMHRHYCATLYLSIRQTISTHVRGNASVGIMRRSLPSL